eukprot:2113674-Rhodomonas_salina.1
MPRKTSWSDELSPLTMNISTRALSPWLLIEPMICTSHWLWRFFSCCSVMPSAAWSFQFFENQESISSRSHTILSFKSPRLDLTSADSHTGANAESCIIVGLSTVVEVISAGAGGA